MEGNQSENLGDETQYSDIEKSKTTADNTQPEVSVYKRRINLCSLLMYFNLAIIVCFLLNALVGVFSANESISTEGSRTAFSLLFSLLAEIPATIFAGMNLSTYKKLNKLDQPMGKLDKMNYVVSWIIVSICAAIIVYFIMNNIYWATR